VAHVINNTALLALTHAMYGGIIHTLHAICGTLILGGIGGVRDRASFFN
jgi:hypothetical protein